MISVKAIYDGKTLKILDDVKVDTPKRVIITFLEDDLELEGFEMNKIAQEGGAFDFLDADEEDIYTDDLMKELEEKLKIALVLRKSI